MDIEKLSQMVAYIVESYLYGRMHSDKIKKKIVTVSPQHLKAVIEAIEYFLGYLKLAVDIKDKETREYVLLRLIEAYDALARAEKKIRKIGEEEVPDVAYKIPSRVISENPDRDLQKEGKK